MANQSDIEIHNRWYFSDVSLRRKPGLQKYLQYLQEGDYNAAQAEAEYEMGRQQINHDINYYYDASILNAVEDRLEILEDVVMNASVKPDLCAWSTDEPRMDLKPVEEGIIGSTHNYRQSDYFFYQDHLCRALVAIEIGDDLRINENYERVDGYSWIDSTLL